MSFRCKFPHTLNYVFRCTNNLIGVHFLWTPLFRWRREGKRAGVWFPRRNYHRVTVWEMTQQRNRSISWHVPCCCCQILFTQVVFLRETPKSSCVNNWSRLRCVRTVIQSTFNEIFVYKVQIKETYERLVDNKMFSLKQRQNIPSHGKQISGTPSLLLCNFVRCRETSKFPTASRNAIWATCRKAKPQPEEIPAGRHFPGPTPETGPQRSYTCNTDSFLESQRDEKLNFVTFW